MGDKRVSVYFGIFGMTWITLPFVKYKYKYNVSNWTQVFCPALNSGLQKDWDRGTGAPKEGMCSIGRFGIKNLILLKLASNKPY